MKIHVTFINRVGYEKHAISRMYLEQLPLESELLQVDEVENHDLGEYVLFQRGSRRQQPEQTR